MQILIADDKQECREMVRKALRAVIPECHFTLAQDGTHAWWELTSQRARFDLLIVDVNMPSSTDSNWSNACVQTPR